MSESAAFSTLSTSQATLLTRQRWGVVAALLLFLALGIWYSLVVPPFETPDEIYHYAFVRHLAQGNSLPVQSSAVEAAWAQEGSQAPLYYLLAGWLTAGIDQSDFDHLAVLNPRANIGDPLFPGNKNRMLYSAAPHPLQGANLALHVARWFSLGLGLLTLWFTYLSARLVFAPAYHWAILTLWVVATIPQFLFISAACSNDNLINAASAAVVYWLLRLVARNASPNPPNPYWASQGRKPIRSGATWVLDWLILGILLGIAALSKLQGLGLFALSGLVGVYLAWMRRDLWWLLKIGLLVAIPALGIAGWWYWRNYTLYGDWLGVQNLLANNGLRDNPLTFSRFWLEFRGLRYSFWGLFGWFNLLLPPWIYALLDAITLTGLAGLAYAGIRNTQYPIRSALRTPYSALLGAWALLSFGLILYWASRAMGSQGRLLFPAIGAFVTLLVLGLAVWIERLPQKWPVISAASLPVLLAGCSLYTLGVLLPTSYRASAPITSVPADAQPVDVVYGTEDTIRLLALDLPDQRFKPGDRMPVTLYLQAPAKLQADYQLFIQLLDEQGQAIANLTSHPGWGRNPTTLWQPGAIYADRYPVLIDKEIANWSPLWARLYVGFVDPKTEANKLRLPVPAHTQAGVEYTDGPFLAHVAVSPRQPPTDMAGDALGVQFGNVIELTRAHTPTDLALTTTTPLTVTLLWTAIGTPATDYTAFVQLRASNGQPVTGFDRAPAAERFPTSQWRSGDQIVSSLPLSLPAGLPAGDYTLWMGLYESASQGTLRLPITAATGRTTGDGEVLIAILALHK